MSHHLLHVLTFEHAPENPCNHPPAWPAQIVMAEESDPVPENWVAMTPEQYAAYEVAVSYNPPPPPPPVETGPPPKSLEQLQAELIALQAEIEAAIAAGN